MWVQLTVGFRFGTALIPKADASNVKLNRSPFPSGTLGFFSMMMAGCMLSLKYKFERRIGLYPAGFDNDGTMYVSTGYGDYPCLTPNQATDHRTGTFAGWMLLSYK